LKEGVKGGKSRGFRAGRGKGFQKESYLRKSLKMGGARSRSQREEEIQLSAAGTQAKKLELRKGSEGLRWEKGEPQVEKGPGGSIGEGGKRGGKGGDCCWSQENELSAALGWLQKRKELEGLGSGKKGREQKAEWD